MDAVRTRNQSSSNTPVVPFAGVEARLKVWIDQDLCTGDGLCTDWAPEVFTLLEDGIAYVMEEGRVLHDPGGPSELAVVQPAQEANVIHAAAECPGECIFIELDEAPAIES